MIEPTDGSAEGTTIFLTTHNMAEAEKLCNLIAVIRKGRLLAFGNPAELRARGGQGSLEEAFLTLMEAEP